MAEPAVSAQVVYTDDEEQKKLNQIAKHLTQATNTYHTVSEITPPANLHPIPQIVQVPVQEEEVKPEVKEPEVMDIMKGLQGKPRTGPSADFLEAKMRMVSKKTGGAGVKLREK